MAYRQTGHEVNDYNRGSYDGINYNQNLPSHVTGSNFGTQPGTYQTVTSTDHYEQFGR